MASTYTLNNGIELIGTGEQSGTWGDTTNENLQFIDTALDGQVTITATSAGTSGSPNTLPIADGQSLNSEGRNRMVIITSATDLGSTVYYQLTPNDAEKIIYIRNDLNAQDLILFQGTYNSSNDYVVPNGTTAVIYFDGNGSGAVAANVFNNAYFDSLRLGSVSVTAILDEDDMSSDSATALATQQSIKAYVDTQITAEDLDFAGDSGTGAVDLDSQSLTIAGTSNEIETSASGQTLTIGLPDDVTIAGDLTVDTDTLYVDSTNNRVGVGTTSPSQQLHLSSTTPVLRMEDTDVSSFAQFDASNGNLSIQADQTGLTADSFIRFQIDSAERLRIDSAGHVLLGGVASSVEVDTNDAGLQLNHSGELSYFSQARFRNNTAAARHYFSKSRSTSTGTYGTIVQDGDNTGQIIWTADDGVDSNSQVASIDAVVDGAPSADDMPGRLVFSTTADGANSVTERMRINSSGHVTIGSGGSQTNNLTVYDSAADSAITIQSADASTAGLVFGDATDFSRGRIVYDNDDESMAFETNNLSEAMRIDSSQRVLIGGDTNISSATVQVSKTAGGVNVDNLMYANSANSPVVRMSKTRSATIGTVGTVVQADDFLGLLGFNGDDGTDLQTNAGYIAMQVDGTPGSNDMPGRLIFATTPDGSSAATERMRIDSSGRVAIQQKLSVGGSITATSPDASFTVQNSGADVGKVTAVFGADTNTNTLSDVTNKEARVGIPHYDISEEPAALFYATSSNTQNIVNIGGGTSRMNAATDVIIRTASNTTTSTGTEAMRIDSSQRVLIGDDSSVAVNGFENKLQVTHSGYATASLTVYRNGSDGAGLNFAHSRSGTVGTNTILQDGDAFGHLYFLGADGTDFASRGAAIISRVDGTPGSNDMPGRLEFHTTADGASSSTERMRIHSNGDVGIYGSDGSSQMVFFDRSSDEFTINQKAQFSYSLTAHSVRTSGNAAYSFRIGNVSGIGARARIRFLGSIGYGSPGFGEVIVDCGIGNDGDEFQTNVTATGSYSTINTSGGIRVYTDRISSTSYDVWIYFGTYARTSYYVDNAFGFQPYFDNTDATGSSIPGTAVQTNWASNGKLQQDELQLLTANNTEIARFDASGLSFDGGSNYLDSYEEGTWTPEMADASSGGNVATGGTKAARYVKIGKMVHIYIVMLNMNTSGLTSANNLHIRNLPFTSLGSGTTYPQAAIKMSQVTFSGYVTAQVQQGSTSIVLNETTSGATYDFVECGQVNSGSNEFLIQAAYEVN